MEVDHLSNKPSQYWHLMSYCDTKKEDDRFTRSIVCGELLLWMAEVIDCVPKEQLEKLVNKIVSCRISAPSGRYIFDRRRWNKEIQKLCFDSIASVINQIQ